MILTIGWILTAPEARRDGARVQLLMALEHLKALKNLRANRHGPAHRGTGCHLQGLQGLVVLRGPRTHGIPGTLRATGQDGDLAHHEPRGPGVLSGALGPRRPMALLGLCIGAQVESDVP